MNYSTFLIRELASFIGYDYDGPVTVSTDNKGAYDLCHRFTSAANSRHVDRKLFKMRELRGAGVVVVKHVGTEHNPADLFTKVLGRQPFERHRRTVLNLSAGERIETLRAARAKSASSTDVKSAVVAFAAMRKTRAVTLASTVPRAFFG